MIFGSAIFSVVGLIYFGNVTAGTAGLSISYALSITQTLNWMVRQSCEIETNIVSVERVIEYTKLTPEAPDELPDVPSPPGWPSRGVVAFKNYSSRYREGLDLVLKDVNFEVKAGEKVGIVGRSGSGKSSCMLALFRLIEPASGSIVVDGVNITKIGLHDLRSQITIIPQEPLVFAGPLRESLDPFGTSTDADIWSALESSHMADTVRHMDKKLDTNMLQNGENLSIGQRQLLCLARAILRRSTILVCDEMSSAIDVETDMLLQETIRTEFKHCTVLTIAHRINTVMDSDRILVISNGRVAEFDTPTTLLANRESAFYGLAKQANLVQ